MKNEQIKLEITNELYFYLLKLAKKYNVTFEELIESYLQELVQNKMK